MAVNYKNSKYEIVTTKRTVPLNEAGTGTIRTSGTHLIGVGTVFTDELSAGAWIVSLSQDEVRKVKSVESATLATLDQAFSVDLPALTALDFIAKNSCNVYEISMIIPLGNAAGEIDGLAFPAGIPYELSKASRERSGGKDFVDPVIVDATATSMLVSTLQ